MLLLLLLLYREALIISAADTVAPVPLLWMMMSLLVGCIGPAGH